MGDGSELTVDLFRGCLSAISSFDYRCESEVGGAWVRALKECARSLPLLGQGVRTLAASALPIRSSPDALFAQSACARARKAQCRIVAAREWCARPFFLVALFLPKLDRRPIRRLVRAGVRG